MVPPGPTSSIESSYPCVERQHSFGTSRIWPSLQEAARKLCIFTTGCCRVGAGGCGVASPLASRPREHALRNGGELVNDLLAKQWPYISDWFWELMKESVEPELKRYISESVELLSCGLGTRPLRLENVATSLHQQDWLSEAPDRTNILVTGDLDFRSDGEMCVAAGTDGRMARVKLTCLEIRGPIVIELVKLHNRPPWFSGLRAHFPSLPHLDITVSTEVFVLDKFIDFDRKVKSIILDQLKSLINNYAVLPNRLAVALAKDLDPFQLRHPPPQGVLRIEVVKHVGEAPWEAHKQSPDRDCRILQIDSHSTGRVKRQKVHPQAGPAIAPNPQSTKTLLPAVGTGRLPSVVLAKGMAQKQEMPALADRGPASPINKRLQRWFRRTSTDGIASADVNIGTTVTKCHVGEARDFLLDDWERQHVNIAVRGPRASGPAAGSARCSVAELVANQSASQPAEVPVTLTSDDGHAAGCIHLKAHLRHIPSTQLDLSRAMSLPTRDSSWAHGEPFQRTWLCMVDLYYAAGLLHVESGTELWATVSIRDSSDGRVLEEQESPCQPAGPPAQHGLELLRDALGSLPQNAEAVLRQEVSADAWRQLLGRTTTGQQCSGGSRDNASQPVDAVWEHPFRLLLGTGKGIPVEDAIRAAEVCITVWRPECGLTRDPQSGKRPGSIAMGSACFRLLELMKEDHFSHNVSLPLYSSQSGQKENVRGCVWCRLQVRPLQQAQDLAVGQFWNQMNSGAQRWANQVMHGAHSITNSFRGFGHLAHSREDELPGAAPLNARGRGVELAPVASNVAEPQCEDSMQRCSVSHRKERTASFLITAAGQYMAAAADTFTAVCQPLRPHSRTIWPKQRIPAPHPRDGAEYCVRS